MHPPDASPPGATLLDEMLEDMLRRRYLVVDGQGRISRWSAGAEALLGWREQEVVGRSAFGQPFAWAGEGVELWKGYFAAAQAARPPARAQLTMLCRGGWGLSVEMIAVPVPLVLGYEFTMLVADLAVGGQSSQSSEQLAQAHPLAADAIASALSHDSAPADAVAGLLVTLRAVAEAAVIEDTDAHHAARALAIEQEDDPSRLPVDEAEDDSPDTAKELAEAHASLRAASGEVARLREEIGSLRVERDALERQLDEARIELSRAAGRRDELERASRRCDELSAALDAKTAELQSLPGRHALDAAKRDRDVARSALAGALAERDRATGALDAAADERDRAGAALRRAESERDEARAALAEAESESEAAHAELAEHEARADKLRSRLEEAEHAAVERAADVEVASRAAAEQRERVAAGHLETEALAHERARVRELEGQIAALSGELEGAVARAAEHGSATTAPARPFQPGLDDTDFPRAYIGLDGRFTALNDGFCRLIGYSEAEFSGAHWPPVVDTEHRSALRRATARLIGGELSACDVDTVYMSGNGVLVPVVGTLRLERDDSGSAGHLVLDAQPLAVVTA